MVHSSVPDMAVYSFEHLDLVEVKRVCCVMLESRASHIHLT